MPATAPIRPATPAAPPPLPSGLRRDDAPQRRACQRLLALAYDSRQLCLHAAERLEAAPLQTLLLAMATERGHLLRGLGQRCDLSLAEAMQADLGVFDTEMQIRRAEALRALGRPQDHPRVIEALLAAESATLGEIESAIETLRRDADYGALQQRLGRMRAHLGRLRSLARNTTAPLAIAQ